MAGSGSNEYPFNTVVKLAVTVTVSDVLTDPSSITCKVRDPDGIVTTLSTTHSGTGVFTATQKGTKAGTWYYRFDGLGAAEGGAEESFRIDPDHTDNG